MDSGTVKASTSGAAAYERFRRAIVHVELAPGTPVSEAQLVDSYRLSKAAVHAGLARSSSRCRQRRSTRRSPGWLTAALDGASRWYSLWTDGNEGGALT